MFVSICTGVLTTGTYYVSLRIVNRSGKDIVVMPSDNNPPLGWKVKKGYIVKLTKSSTANAPIALTAKDPSTQELVKINGKDSVVLKPSETKQAPETYEILLPGMKPGMLLFMSLTADHFLHHFAAHDYTILYIYKIMAEPFLSQEVWTYVDFDNEILS